MCIRDRVAAILGFTVASGLYFVRGIVVPLGQVERDVYKRQGLHQPE